MGSPDDHRRVVTRLFDEVWNGGRVEVIPELYAEDFVADYRPYTPLRHGHDGIRQMIEGARATFEDFHEELLGLVVDERRAAIHLRVSGIQCGPWGPVPPTGRRLEFEEMIMLTFADDGRVVHQRGIVDNLLGLRQAGAIPSPRSGPDAT